METRRLAADVTYDAASDRYTLPDEHALALADEDSPFYILGVYDSVASLYADEDQILEAFRSGEGMGWHEHDHRRSGGPSAPPRLPSPPDRRVDSGPGWSAGEARTRCQGRRCRLRPWSVDDHHGRGVPQPEFFGFDYHAPSIERAHEAAKEAGVDDRITFATDAAKEYPGHGYDLVCVFDCLHDMGDPVGASRHVLETLDADGTWMIVEPFANDRVEDNLNPIGRIFYGASTVICTPASLSQEVGLALGAQAGEARLTEVLEQGGFARVRRATETPFNLILEARP